MDFELALASKRLEKEAAKRKAAEAARLERQRAEKDRVEAKRLELEAHQAEERRAAAEAAARLRDRHDILLEKNKGLWACQTLAPTLNRSAESAGIRRRADKISLPRSFGAALTGQHSHAHHGQMFFELSVGHGRLTHAALLDFEAPEGTVGLPPKVLRCLGLDGALGAVEAAGAPASEPAAAVVARGAPAGTAPPMVTVAYRGLQAGTYAKLQPTSASFQRELGDIKLALELELQTHCTLSEGDVVNVRSLEDGGTHELRVLSLMPEGAVSILDTDLEVDIAPSLEAERAQAAEEAARLAAAAAQRAAEQAEAEAAAAEAAAAARAAAAAAAAREAAAAALAAEPAEGSGATVSLALKLPTGERRTRRFAHSQPLATVFAFVDTLDLGGSSAGSRPMYRLASQFPRRVWERPDEPSAAGISMADAGLGGKQEALFVELLGS